MLDLLYVEFLLTHACNKLNCFNGIFLIYVHLHVISYDLISDIYYSCIQMHIVFYSTYLYVYVRNACLF